MRVVWCGFLGLAASAGAAQAAGVESLRVGVTAHNICLSDCDNANKERGPNINGEVSFDSPGFLKPVFSPKPYVMASVNTAGKTSFAATGLEWQVKLGENWSVETGVGYAVHNGEIDFPFPQGDPRNNAVSAENVFFGSRDLFRSSLVVGRMMGEQWGLEAVYEHYSHGQILGKGRNQGIDMLGVRVRYWPGED
jgi:lipid A 3-O-deacylase